MKPTKGKDSSLSERERKKLESIGKKMEESIERIAAEMEKFGITTNMISEHLRATADTTE